MEKINLVFDIINKNNFYGLFLVAKGGSCLCEIEIANQIIEFITRKDNPEMIPLPIYAIRSYLNEININLNKDVILPGEIYGLYCTFFKDFNGIILYNTRLKIGKFKPLLRDFFKRIIIKFYNLLNYASITGNLTYLRPVNIECQKFLTSLNQITF